MSRLVKKSPAVCTDLPLENSDVCHKLKLLRKLLTSCFGPSGRLKQIHNNIGGHVVTTSSSSVLLPLISSSQPLINLIKASIHSHVSRFSDCGLFAAILCLALIERAQQCNVRRNLVIKVNQHLLSVCSSYLQQDDCACKVKLDFCSTLNLITIARSIISSKPACVLTKPEMLHISKLAVQAFLLTVPCNSPGTVILGRTVTVSVEGHTVLDSAVFPGLLIDIPCDVQHTEVSSHLDNPLLVVLFSSSLAGDLSELEDGIIEVHPGLDIDSQILDQLLDFGKQVIKDQVKVFVCQKVIHPVLQQYLRNHGVIVIERLGISLMEPLAKLTGAKSVATLQTKIPPESYGKVKGLTIKEFGAKKMLHLHPDGESAICTLILCHRNETMLNELKVVCQKTEHVLRLTLKEPFALLGGGCTETHLAAYVRHQSKNRLQEVASLLGCSQTEYLLGVDVFCQSLESVARGLEHDDGVSFIDLTHAHHWLLPADVTECSQDSFDSCGCGLVKSNPNKKWTHLNTEYADFCPVPLLRDAAEQPRVLDSFRAKLNALHVAVETANLVLDVGYVIQDVN